MESSSAQIRDLDGVSVWVNEDVLRLDVSMSKSTRVYSLNAHQHLQEDVQASTF